VLDRYLRNIYTWRSRTYGTLHLQSFMYATGTTHEDLADIMFMDRLTELLLPTDWR